MEKQKKNAKTLGGVRGKVTFPPAFPFLSQAHLTPDVTTPLLLLQTTLSAFGEGTSGTGVGVQLCQFLSASPCLAPLPNFCHVLPKKQLSIFIISSTGLFSVAASISTSVSFSSRLL